jgi:hypothetical protein
MAHEKMLEELAARRAKALGMGGPDKLAKRKAQGVLDARSRLDLLLDDGSFVESGLFATSFRAEDRERTLLEEHITILRHYQHAAHRLNRIARLCAKAKADNTYGDDRTNTLILAIESAIGTPLP